MPISYDQSSLLKCTVSMSYIRYVVDGSNPPITASSESRPTTGAVDYPGNIVQPLSLNDPSKVKVGGNPYSASGSDFGPAGQASFNTSQALNVGLPASGAGTAAFTPSPQGR